MSVESAINQNPDAEPAPSQDFTPMSDAYAQPKEEPKTFDGPSQIDNVRDATAERLRKKRDDSEPVIRQYVDLQTNEPRPGHETVSIERASEDLARQRGLEQQEAQKLDDALLALRVDSARQGLDPAQLLAQHAEQQQPEAQQPEIAPQPQTELPPEIAELQQELERSPKLKAMLQAEAQNIQQAQQQFQQATQQATALAVHSLVASFPELSGLSPQQIPVALQILKTQNPQRHADVVRHIDNVNQLGRQAAELQQQQAVQVQQQTAAWAKAQDDAFDAATAKDSPETRSKIGAEAMSMLKEYGLTDEQIRAEWNGGSLRSAAAQLILRDAASFRLAQKQIATKAHVDVHPTQRPGTSQPRSSFADGQVQQAREAFLKNADDPRAAARYIMAKRAAKSKGDEQCPNQKTTR